MFGEINCENLEYFRAIKRENLENGEIFGGFNIINFEDFGKSCIFASSKQRKKWLKGYSNVNCMRKCSSGNRSVTEQRHC